MEKLLRKMSPQDIYREILGHVHKTNPSVGLHQLFINYRSSQNGLRLTPIGTNVLIEMGYPYKDFCYNSSVLSSSKAYILLERYCTYPYFVSAGRLTLFDYDDSILFKMYGCDMDVWIEYMENNLPTP